MNVRPIAAYRRTQRSSLQLGLRVGGHLALTDCWPDDPKWTLAYGWCHIDSTINVVLGIIIIIIIITACFYSELASCIDSLNATDVKSLNAKYLSNWYAFIYILELGTYWELSMCVVGEGTVWFWKWWSEWTVICCRRSAHCRWTGSHRIIILHSAFVVVDVPEVGLLFLAIAVAAVYVPECCDSLLFLWPISTKK